MVSGKEGLLFGSYVAVFLLCSHMVEGTRELSRVFFIRALIPVMEALPSHDLITSQRSCLQIPSPWGLVFNIKVWEGTAYGPCQMLGSGFVALCWIEVEKGELPCLVPHLGGGAFRFSQLRMLVVGSSYMTFWSNFLLFRVCWMFLS